MTDFSPQTEIFPYFEEDFGIDSQKKHKSKSTSLFITGVIFMPLFCVGMECIKEASYENSIIGVYKIVTAALVSHGSLPDSHLQKTEADQIINDFYSWYVAKNEDTELSKHEFTEQIVRAYYLRALTTDSEYTGVNHLPNRRISNSTAYDIIYYRIFSRNKIASLKDQFKRLKSLHERLKKLNFADSYIYSTLELESFIEKSEREKIIRDASALREKKNRVDN